MCHRFSDETNSDDTDKKEKPQEKTKEARVVKAEQRKLTHDKGSKGQDRAERQRHENEDDSDSDWGLALNDDSSENDDESTDEDREKAKRFVPVGAPTMRQGGFKICTYNITFNRYIVQLYCFDQTKNASFIWGI